jgi:hypothetical protein
MRSVRDPVKKKQDPYRIFDTVAELNQEIRRRFGEPFVFLFRPERETCLICGTPLEYYKSTRVREFQSLRYGPVCFREIQARCPTHKYDPEDGTPIIYGSSFLRTLVPSGAGIAYDVIVSIGRKRFIESRQVEEVVKELEGHAIRLSTSSVSRWADYFLAAVECLHETNVHKLRHLIRKAGGYLLHVDASRENTSDTVFVCMDRVQRIVLLSERISTENAEDIESALRILKKNFGIPKSIMRDMGHPIKAAVLKVFPGVSDRICHYHFLSDVGKDLMAEVHVALGHELANRKINPHLQGLKREFERSIPNELVEKTRAALEDVEGLDQLRLPSLREVESVLALRLIDWIYEYPSEGQGLGFPFDVLRLSYYRRMNTVRLRLARYEREHPRILNGCPALEQLQRVLQRITDAPLSGMVRDLRSRYADFQHLRSVLRFTITNKAPLSDTMSIGTIKEVRAYNRDLVTYTKRLQVAERRGEIKESEQIILNHLREHQFELPIPEHLAAIFLSALDSTNNLEEGGFRDDKRGPRRQVGKKDISREYTLYGPYLPLIRNLTNENYIAAVVGKIEDLPIRIGETDPRKTSHYLEKLKEARKGKFSDQLKAIDAVGILPHG